MTKIIIEKWEVQSFPFETRNWSLVEYRSLLQMSTNLHGINLKRVARSLVRKEPVVVEGVMAEYLNHLKTRLYIMAQF